MPYDGSGTFRIILLRSFPAYLTRWSPVLSHISFLNLMSRALVARNIPRLTARTTPGRVASALPSTVRLAPRFSRTAPNFHGFPAISVRHYAQGPPGGGQGGMGGFPGFKMGPQQKGEALKEYVREPGCTCVTAYSLQRRASTSHKWRRMESWTLL